MLILTYNFWIFFCRGYVSGANLLFLSFVTPLTCLIMAQVQSSELSETVKGTFGQSFYSVVCQPKVHLRIHLQQIVHI